MKFFKSPMGFITTTMFLNFMGLTVIIPVIPYIVARYTPHVALYVGLITSLAAFCQFLVSPVLGYCSDIWGRRPVVLWSLVGGIVGYVIFGIGGSLLVLFLARMIDGLSSGDTTAMYAYVADIFESHERTKYYGTLGAAAGLGFMIGPAIGGLASKISLSAPLFVAAGISLANVVWGYFAMPESLLVKNRARKKFSLRNLNPFTQFKNALTSFTLRIFFLVSFVFFIALVMQQSNFSVFMKDILHWGPINIGIILTLIGLVDFFAEGYLVGKLLPIFGDIPVSRIGITLTAIGMFMVGLVAFNGSMWLFYAAIVVYTIGDGLFEPAMVGLIANATNPEMHGRVQGANQSLQSVARFISPFVAGLLYEQYAFLPYFGGAILLIASFIILYIFSQSLKFTSY